MHVYKINNLRQQWKQIAGGKRV